MLRISIKLFTILLLFVALGSVSMAQQNNQQQPASKEKDYVDFSGFKGKIIEIKNRDPRTLVSILAPLGSGFKGAELKANPDFKTITVRDFPENIAVIEEAIKRLDVPMPAKPPEPSSPPRPDVEIYGYVLIASQGQEGGNDYPKAIEDVVKQLQANLSFKSYRLMTSIVQRTRIGGGVSSSGNAILSDKSVAASYDFIIRRISPENETGEISPLTITGLELKLQGQNSPDGQHPGNARLATDLKIRDGEKVVVGTASLRDKALVLVLTTKIIK